MGQVVFVVPIAPVGPASFHVHVPRFTKLDFLTPRRSLGHLVRFSLCLLLSSGVTALICHDLQPSCFGACLTKVPSLSSPDSDSNGFPVKARLKNKGSASIFCDAKPKTGSLCIPEQDLRFVDGAVKCCQSGRGERLFAHLLSYFARAV